MKFLKNLLDRRAKVTALIEMPQGSTKKIEIKDGLPVVDRELDIPVPISYGYIPGTICEDGDPLDVFVVSDKYLDTGHLLSVRVIGIFECVDQGKRDDKLLAVADGEDCKVLKAMAQVSHYLLNYKPGFKVNGYHFVKSFKELEKYKA